MNTYAFERSPRRINRDTGEMTVTPLINSVIRRNGYGPGEGGNGNDGQRHHQRHRRGQQRHW